MKKAIALLAALILLLTVSIPASAAGATIDTSKVGSITLYKYDLTSAAGDGVPVSSFVATGEKDAAAEAALADYAIQGVKFTYLKVADLGNRMTEPEDGKADVSLLYSMTASDKTANLLSTLGLSYSDAYEADGTTYYFTSDVLNHALNTVMSDTTATKNTLENYIKTNGGTTLAETDANGKVVASDLSLGLYLLVETYVPENVTCTVNPFFVSVPMTTVDGEEWMYDVTVYPKNETGMPTLEKTVREAVADTGKTTVYAHTATASIGDVVEYEIISKLPKEIATDSGYQLLAEEVKIEIIADESETICGICGKAVLTASAKVTDKEVTMTADGDSICAIVPLTIINNHGFDLPPTGAQGTWLLSILGIVGMAASATILFVIALKKRAVNN